MSTATADEPSKEDKKSGMPDPTNFKESYTERVKLREWQPLEKRLTATGPDSLPAFRWKDKDGKLQFYTHVASVDFAPKKSEITDSDGKVYTVIDGQNHVKRGYYIYTVEPKMAAKKP